MKKDISDIVMENLFGTPDLTQKISKPGSEKKGFASGTFYVTGMTFAEYEKMKSEFFCKYSGGFRYF